MLKGVLRLQSLIETCAMLDYRKRISIVPRAQASITNIDCQFFSTSFACRKIQTEPVVQAPCPRFDQNHHKCEEEKRFCQFTLTHSSRKSRKEVEKQNHPAESRYKEGTFPFPTVRAPSLRCVAAKPVPVPFSTSSSLRSCGLEIEKKRRKIWQTNHHPIQDMKSHPRGILVR